MAEGKEKGIQALIKVFNSRKDLQGAFPEVWEGDLRKLVAWSLKYGTTIDISRDILEPYLNDFKTYHQAENKSTFTWDNSAEHYILDGFKIYWETLSRVASYQFECISGDKDFDMLSYTINIIMKNFPDRKIRAGFIGCDELSSPEIRLNERKLCSEIVVMDIANGLLDQQREKARAESAGNIEYLQADFNKFILQENEFDFINAWGTIHHIINLEHFFSQIQKGLKKDGIMVIYEYVGPDYLQFTDEQLTIVYSLLNSMPEELRYYQNKVNIKNIEYRINKEKLIQMDPTESVRSSDIIKVMNEYLDVIEFHNTGGTILHPLLNGIAGNFETSARGDEVLQALIEIEKALIKSGMLPSDYVYIVAKPRK
jgi:ubiquinone/menaquinone biosynthesis C-methylase UbiE